MERLPLHIRSDALALAVALVALVAAVIKALS